MTPATLTPEEIDERYGVVDFDPIIAQAKRVPELEAARERANVRFDELAACDAKRDARIAELEAEVADREHDHELSAQMIIEQQKRIAELEAEVARLKARVPVTRTVRPEVVLEGDNEELDRYRKVAEAALAYRRAQRAANVLNRAMGPREKATQVGWALDDALADVGMKVE